MFLVDVYPRAVRRARSPVAVGGIIVVVLTDLIKKYVNPRNTITMVIRLTIQRHGYGELADTLLAIAASEGVVRGSEGCEVFV